MIPPNLIINADDFGIDERVSKGIAHCVEKGLINSFSVLPFADPFHDDLLKSLIASYPNVRVGSHLSLLDTSLQSPETGPSGLREHPNYYLEFLKLYLTGRYPATKIYSAWKEQILFLGKYLGGANRLAHLDSHQHIHVLPGIWPVAVALQKEFSIPRLRIPYESLGGSLGYKFPFGFALQALAAFRALRSGDAGNSGGRRSYFMGFFTSTQFTLAANRKGIGEVLAHPDRNFELMVHPALPPDSHNARSATRSFDILHPNQFKEVEDLERLQDLFRSQSKA